MKKRSINIGGQIAVEFMLSIPFILALFLTVLGMAKLIIVGQRLTYANFMASRVDMVRHASHPDAYKLEVSRILPHAIPGANDNEQMKTSYFFQSWQRIVPLNLDAFFPQSVVPLYQTNPIEDGDPLLGPTDNPLPYDD